MCIQITKKIRKWMSKKSYIMYDLHRRHCIDGTASNEYCNIHNIHWFTDLIISYRTKKWIITVNRQYQENLYMYIFPLIFLFEIIQIESTSPNIQCKHCTWDIDNDFFASYSFMNWGSTLTAHSLHSFCARSAGYYVNFIIPQWFRSFATTSPTD